MVSSKSENHLAQEDKLCQQNQVLLNISHELRNPLTIITGYIEMLGATRLDSKQQQYLKGIERSSDFLMGLTDEILSILRSKEEQEKLRLSRIDLGDFLQSLRDIYEPLAQKKGLGFFLEVSELPQVRGDVVKLEQVLGNLLNNAIKFTEKGWIRLQVNVFAQDGQTALVTFRVVDTGIGMSASESEQIFEAFYQATWGSGGVGIGLAISKTLCEKMGGRLDVKSSPGVGSVFEVCLPMKLENRLFCCYELGLEEGLSTLNRDIVINLKKMASRGDFCLLKSYIKTRIMPFNNQTSQILLTLVDQFRLDLIVDLLPNYTENIG
ncbi:sensor histidine kinase [Gloeothece verrucosa]|uniref:histidine kinase n=1 Tax=Gloeothece verrucosa (strain PCC 7822) TaxID=497965 RepID=E0ULT6_GLOV7|nr:HAMP domain-containing sensor histidine kinase [Gloeothece verrucosa]ADN17916.1 histidine kinase [Gloeothece verrucosa PCC 7822]